MAHHLPSPLISIVLLFSLPTITSAQLDNGIHTDNGNECSCFRTNSSSQGYFTYHRFHDWRNVAQAAAAPALATNASSATNAFATSNYFQDTSWTSEWSIQSWNNSDTVSTFSASSDATVLMVNSANNVYIESSNDSDSTYSSFLTLRTTRLPTFQSAAEIDSNEQNYLHLSARFMARVIGSDGACAGMFTYLASDPVQEADIEILTGGPRNRVQYTNQPSTDKNGNAVAKATVNGSLPFVRDWTQWNVYRVDWMPEQTSWYVNGESVANISYQVPKSPAGLILNMWSDGGTWTGNMSTFDEAFLQIQYMQVVYNTSGPYAGSDKRKRDEVGVFGLLEKRKGTPGCKVVCSVDEEVNTTGVPALLYNNTGIAPAGWRGEGMGSMVWIPLVLVGGAVFGWL